jgi:hypothetical protein
MSWNRRFSYAALFRLIALGFAGLVTAIIAWLSFVGHRFILEIPISDIYSESGFAYQVDTRALKRGPLFGKGDSNSAPTVSTAVLREGANLLGPAHSLHQQIRDLGGGRFSHWGEHLIFSTSDNTDPRTNNRKYVVETYLYPPLYAVLLAASLFAGALFVNRRGLAQAARVGRRVVTNNRVLQWTGENIIHCRAVRWIRENVMPPLIGTLIVFLALAAIEEVYFRITTPFVESKWPSKFDPQIGFLFEPGAELRYTNHLDFWASERINSLGFADRELNPDMLHRGCHVAFIGDSMVEAAQVPNDEKVQVVLEKKASAMYPEWHLTTSAFGYSGTGQLNQLPFYDSFVHNLRPKLVILVFAGNDFANNSSVLEALRNGWHPDHPPRLFARRDPRTGTYRWIPIDPDWGRYLLKTETPPNSNNLRQRLFHSFMKEHSLFYGWLWRKLSPLHPDIVSRLEGEPTLPELIAMRVEALRGTDDYRRQLRDWDDSYNLDVDAVFYDEELSELFSDAVNLTGFALREFQRRIKQDGGHLVILTTSQMSLPRVPRPGKKHDPLIFRRQFMRLEAIARTLGIPVIDQYTYIVQNGGDLLTAQFRHDAHWTPQGHIWASEAVLNYLEENPQICHPQQLNNTSR